MAAKDENWDGHTPEAKTFDNWLEQLKESCGGIQEDKIDEYRAIYDQQMANPGVPDTSKGEIDLDKCATAGQRIADIWSWTPTFSEAVTKRATAYGELLKRFNDKYLHLPEVGQIAAWNQLKSKKSMLISSVAQQILPRSKSLRSLLAENIPDSKILIPEILNKGAKMTLGGQSKKRKTMTLMDLVICSGCGYKFLDTYDMVESRVFYVNFEIQEEFFKKRWVQLGKEHGASNQEIESAKDNVEVWTLRGHFFSAEQFCEALIEQISGRDFDMICIDPLYKLFNGSDANNSGDMAKVLSAMEIIAATTGAAVVYVDHSQKGNLSNRSTIDKLSGSGVNARDPDAICVFEDHQVDDCVTVSWVLRNFKPTPSIVVEQPEDALRCKLRSDLDPKQLKNPNNKGSIDAGGANDPFLNAIVEAGGTIKSGDLKEKLGWDANKLKNHLRSGKLKGKYQFNKSTNEYSIVNRAEAEGDIEDLANDLGGGDE